MLTKLGFSKETMSAIVPKAVTQFRCEFSNADIRACIPVPTVYEYLLYVTLLNYEDAKKARYTNMCFTGPSSEGVGHAYYWAGGDDATYVEQVHTHQKRDPRFWSKKLSAIEDDDARAEAIRARKERRKQGSQLNELALRVQTNRVTLACEVSFC